MADASKCSILLEQDQLIQVPESLLSISGANPAALAVARCDTAQTICTSCLGAPCQGNNCQTSCQGQCSQSCSQGCSQGCSQTCSQGCNQSCSQVIPKPPTTAGSMTIKKVTSDSVTVGLSSISKATSYEIVWRRSTTTILEGSEETTSRTYTITGLDPDTTYVFNYRGVNDDGVGPFMATGKTVTTLPDRPWDWEWWSSIVSGGEVGLSAIEWNTFCERINEFREYKGLSWYSFTEVSRGDFISASIVNQAVRAIQSMNPPISVPNSVRSGSPLAASFFIGLKNSLNSIP